MKILIIGGGLGGLALAQGLTAAGINVTVFERDNSPASRTQGYRISMSSMGLTALKALLPPERFEALAAAKVKDVGAGFTYATAQLKSLFRAPPGKDYAVQMLRSKLRETLLKGINVEWDKQLVSIRELENKVEAQFTDGSVFLGDLLVGCDGGYSKVREIIRSTLSESPESVPQVIDSGIVIIGGHISRTSEWEEMLPFNRSGPVRFLGPNGHSLFVAFSEREDRSPTIMWLFSQHVDTAEISAEKLFTQCLRAINNEPWHPNLRKLIQQTPCNALIDPWILRTTRFNRTPHLMVSSGRVTLLGDSAHAMPPDRRLGGNNVLEDARVLTQLLISVKPSIDFKKIISEYERTMFQRAKSAVKKSEQSAYIHHLRHPLAVSVRNLILKILDAMMMVKSCIKLGSHLFKLCSRN